MFSMDLCLHVWWDLWRVGEDGSLCCGGWVNGCLQVLRAPSVAGADVSVVSCSGAELKVMLQLMGKAQQWEEIWEMWGRWHGGGREGGREGV